MNRLVVSAANVLAVAALACAPNADPQYLEDGISLPLVSGVSDVSEHSGEPAPCVASVYHIFARAGDHIMHCPVHDRGGVCRDDRHWLTAIDRHPLSGDQLASRLVSEAEKSLESEPDPVVGVRFSSRRVLIRADARAPFGRVNELIELSSLARIYKIDVEARFQTGESEVRCWLPIDHESDPDFVDMRVELRWNEVHGLVTRQLREQAVSGGAALEHELQEYLAQVMRTHTVAPPFTIDSTDPVPWRDAVALIPIARRIGFEDIEFALGEPDTEQPSTIR